MKCESALKSNLDKSFEESDAVMSRCISTAISLSLDGRAIKRQRDLKWLRLIKKGITGSISEQPNLNSDIES